MGGRRFYFNCGTWIRLMRFSDAMLKDTAAFKRSTTCSSTAHERYRRAGSTASHW